MTTRGKQPSKTEQPLVTVTIVSWNRKDDLQFTLQKLREVNYPRGKLEIIVVDNASTDGSVEIVREKFPEVKLICLPENKGLFAYNVGFATAQGKYIVVLDDDSFPAKDAIATAVSKLEKCPYIGVVAGKILSAETGEPLERFLPSDCKEREWFTFCGCGAIFRKGCLQSVGGYSSNFFLYVNEIDFSLRALEAGWSILFSPSVLFFHNVSSLHRTSGRKMFYDVRNYILVVWKYFPFFIALDMTLGIMISHLKAALKDGIIAPYLKGLLCGLALLPKELRRRNPLHKSTLNKVQPFMDWVSFRGLMRKIYTKLTCKSCDDNEQ